MDSQYLRRQLRYRQSKDLAFACGNPVCYLIPAKPTESILFPKHAHHSLQNVIDELSRQVDPLLFQQIDRSHPSKEKCLYIQLETPAFLSAFSLEDSITFAPLLSFSSCQLAICAVDMHFKF